MSTIQQTNTASNYSAQITESQKTENQKTPAERISKEASDKAVRQLDEFLASAEYRAMKDATICYELSGFNEIRKKQLHAAFGGIENAKNLSGAPAVPQNSAPTEEFSGKNIENYMDTVAGRYAKSLSRIEKTYGDKPEKYEKHINALNKAYENIMNIKAEKAADAITRAEYKGKNLLYISGQKTVNGKTVNLYDLENPKNYQNKISPEIKSISSKFVELFKENIKENSFEDALNITKSKLNEMLSESETELLAKINDLGKDFSEFGG